ncbi:MAG: cysteine-rich repeat protein, partial [Cognaticolwellia sp.]
MRRLTLLAGTTSLLFLPSIASASTCGDGVLDGTETCDDGNTSAGDGCDTSCALEVGYECSEGTSFALDYDEDLASSTFSPDASAWALNSDLSARQDGNSGPSVYMSDIPVDGVTISFDVEVDTSSDDDFTGFIAGYSSGDNTSSSADYIIWDWKQSTQLFSSGCIGAAGTSLNHVTGKVSDQELWCHSGDVDELQRGSTYGSTGWSDSTVYTVTVEYSSSQIDVYIDGTLDISITASSAGLSAFPTGDFGIYTQSQEDVEFDITSPTTGDSTCTELDSDGDGVSDNIEIAAGMDEFDPDSDGDGVEDGTEYGSTSGSGTDTDGDGTIDALDTDDDGDGVPTEDEYYGSASGPEDQDSDGDGTLDYLDTDDDNDGVLTLDEAYGSNTDPQLEDTDSDGTPDYIDTDDDGDGIETEDEDLDGDGDPSNDDSDGDGTADYLDADDDNDGVPTVDEDGDGDGDPTNDDTDGDGTA